MRTPAWIIAGALALASGCAMEASDPDDSDAPAERDLGGVDLGIDGLDVDDCGTKPLFEEEAYEELVPHAALEQGVEPAKAPPWIEPEGRSEGEGFWLEANEHYLEAFPAFDDCTLPGNTCWD
jgi:hypothetical protein